MVSNRKLSDMRPLRDVLSGEEWRQLVTLTTSRMKVLRETVNTPKGRASQQAVANLLHTSQPNILNMEKSTRTDFSLPRFIQLCLLYGQHPAVVLQDIMEEFDNPVEDLPAYMIDGGRQEGSDYV